MFLISAMYPKKRWSRLPRGVDQRPTGLRRVQSCWRSWEESNWCFLFVNIFPVTHNVMCCIYINVNLQPNTWTSQGASCLVYFPVNISTFDSLLPHLSATVTLLWIVPLPPILSVFFHQQRHQILRRESRCKTIIFWIVFSMQALLIVYSLLGMIFCKIILHFL